MASFGGCFLWLSVAVLVIAAGLPLLLSEFAGGWTRASRSSFSPEKMSRLDGKTVLVTGANTGIGRVTAVELARKGALVLVHGRSQERLKAVLDDIHDAGGKARAVIADFGRLETVAVMAAAVREITQEPLDIVVLNAGLCKDCVGKTDAGFEMTKDGFELHIQVNHLANQLLVELLMRSGGLSKSTRLVTVSSALHQQSYPEGMRLASWRKKDPDYTDGAAYGQSKLANIMMAHYVQQKIGIPSVSVHPGIIATDLGRYSDKEEHSLGMTVFRALFKFARMTTEQGALTQLWAATQPSLTEGYFTPVANREAVNHPAFSDAASADCWDKTHAAIQGYIH